MRLLMQITMFLAVLGIAIVLILREKREKDSERTEPPKNGWIEDTKTEIRYYSTREDEGNSAVQYDNKDRVVDAVAGHFGCDKNALLYMQSKDGKEGIVVIRSDMLLDDEWKGHDILYFGKINEYKNRFLRQTMVSHITWNESVTGRKCTIDRFLDKRLFKELYNIYEKELLRLIRERRRTEEGKDLGFEQVDVNIDIDEDTEKRA